MLPANKDTQDLLPASKFPVHPIRTGRRLKDLPPHPHTRFFYLWNMRVHTFTVQRAPAFTSHGKGHHVPTRGANEATGSREELTQRSSKEADGSLQKQTVYQGKLPHGGLILFEIRLSAWENGFSRAGGLTSHLVHTRSHPHSDKSGSPAV